MNWSSPKVATLILLIWIGVVFLIGCQIGLFNGKMFRFGPALSDESPIIIFGFKIDSMKKVIGVMLYSFVSKIISEYGENIISPWITNVIQDTKSDTIPFTKLTIMMIHNGYNIFGWLNYVIQIMMVFTMELQFILPKMIASLIMGNVTTWNYISNKRFKPHEL